MLRCPETRSIPAAADRARQVLEFERANGRSRGQRPGRQCSGRGGIPAAEHALGDRHCWCGAISCVFFLACGAFAPFGSFCGFRSYPGVYNRKPAHRCPPGKALWLAVG